MTLANMRENLTKLTAGSFCSRKLTSDGLKDARVETKNGAQREYQWHSPSKSWSPRRPAKWQPPFAWPGGCQRFDGVGLELPSFAFDRFFFSVVRRSNRSSRRSVCRAAGQHDQRQRGRQESLTGGVQLALSCISCGGQLQRQANFRFHCLEKAFGLSERLSRFSEGGCERPRSPWGCIGGIRGDDRDRTFRGKGGLIVVPFAPQ
jgi:hypothetical protein